MNIEAKGFDKTPIPEYNPPVPWNQRMVALHIRLELAIEDKYGGARQAEELAKLLERPLEMTRACGIDPSVSRDLLIGKALGQCLRECVAGSS